MATGSGSSSPSPRIHGDVVSGNVVVETESPWRRGGCTSTSSAGGHEDHPPAGEAERHVPFPGGPHRMADDPPRARGLPARSPEVPFQFQIP